MEALTLEAESYRPMAKAMGSFALEEARRFWHSMRRWWWHSWWQLRVEGVENVPRRGPVILCANHSSHLDAPAILAALPQATALRTSTAAAKDVFGQHPLRNAASRIITNSVSIDRKSEFAAGLRQLEAVLEQRRPLILFPEGRRSPDGSLLDFKPGAAMLSIRTGTPIVPIRLVGLHESLARGHVFPFPAKVTVHFGKPIDPTTVRDAIQSNRLRRKDAYQQLTAQLHRAIEQLQ